MKHVRLISIIAIAITLWASTRSFQLSPMESDLKQAVADRWISEKWLTDHRRQVEDSIVAHISERYPTIPDEMSGIALGRVTVSNDVRKNNRSAVDSTERELDELFKRPWLSLAQMHR